MSRVKGQESQIESGSGVFSIGLGSDIYDLSRAGSLEIEPGFGLGSRSGIKIRFRIRVNRGSVDELRGRGRVGVRAGW